MQLRKLLTDEDRAVSPVIGVILMVAITVILAAVIASFVLGLGSTSDPAPTPTLEWSTEADYDFSEYEDIAVANDESDAIVIDVTGGDAFDSSDVNVTVSGVSVNDDSEPNVEGDEAFSWVFAEDEREGDEISAGSTLAIPVDSLDGWEVDLIYDPADGDPEIITSQED